MSEKTVTSARQSSGSILNRWLLVLIPIGAWVCALVVLVIASDSAQNLPPIAVNGLADVYGFYLPLMIVTLITIFLLTWKRERPDWKGFALQRETAGREVLLALCYLIVIHGTLGAVFGIGLHFPGPDLFDTSRHGIKEVVTWVVMQTIFFIAAPLLWLHRRGFSLGRLLANINFKRDWWIMLLFWCADFFGVVAISDFNSVPAGDYASAVPFGILVNTLGAGLPVLIMIHLIIIPRLSILFDNQLFVILLGGVAYAIFSAFDPGTVYSDSTNATITCAYVLSTQMLIGMGKASLTVRTGNPFIHFTSYHILGARVAFDTGMYSQILR